MSKPYRGHISEYGIIWHPINKCFAVAGKFRRAGMLHDCGFVLTSAIVTLTANTVETNNSLYSLGHPNQTEATKAWESRPKASFGQC